MPDNTAVAAESGKKTVKLTTQAAVASLSMPAGLTEKIFFDDELAGINGCEFLS